MNRLFLLLFGAVSLVAHAQVPDYVPTEGLVAWYPFNGNANDESGNAYHGEINGALLTADRFLEPNSAYSFSGNCQDRIDMLVPEMTENTSFSVSFWAKRNGTGCYNPRMWEFYGGSRTTQCGWFNDWDSITFSGFPIVGANLENEIWYHFALTNTGNTWEAYFNGEFNNLKVDSTVINSPDLAIGRMNHPAWDSFNGEIDDFAIWNRALSAEEVLALYNAQLPVQGCTDPTACNYNDEANEDDGSCVYPLFGDDCDTGGAACGEGTVWDSANQSCVAWNDCPSDLDGDGVIGVSDLMTLLADFGNPCPPAWSCGELYTYHGHDYATVQIGDLCWFGEELQSTISANGNAILHAQSTEEWLNAAADGVPAYCHLNDDPIHSSVHGLLYNGWAATAADTLCPAGWHVADNGDFTNLLQIAGEENVCFGCWMPIVGTVLKASPTDSPAWNGTDSLGFETHLNGLRHVNGTFLETQVWYWSSNQPTIPWQNGANWRVIESDPVFWGADPLGWGGSIRCIKD